MCSDMAAKGAEAMAAMFGDPAMSSLNNA